MILGGLVAMFLGLAVMVLSHSIAAGIFSGASHVLFVVVYSGFQVKNISF